MTTIEQPQTGAAGRPETHAADVAVVGGAGHVGLPLSVAFAEAGYTVALVDTARHALAAIAAGQAPFMEPGLDELIRRSIAADRLALSSTAAGISGAGIVVLAVSIPDESRWSSVTALDATIDDLLPYLADGALLVIRNTVYPGTAAHIRERLRAAGRAVSVVACPERMLQGNALQELRELPQIVGADEPDAGARASVLFERLGVPTLLCSTIEAEVAKLVANAWRYISFAAANEFATVARSGGVDYGAVLRVVRDGYPRAAALPGPGFAAGPCLPKDTFALAEFGGQQADLMRAALDINEQLPARIVTLMKQRFGDLSGRRIGVLGMAFKRGSDDTRHAPSAVLRELLTAAGASVMATDVHARDPENLPLREVVDASEIVVIATPHDEYRSLDIPAASLVDVFGITRAGIQV